MNNFRYKAGDKVAIKADLDKVLWGKMLKKPVEEFDNIFTIERMIDTDSYKLKEIDSHYIHHNLLEKIKETTDPIDSRFEILDL